MENVLLTTSRLLLKGISPILIHELFASRSKGEIQSFFGVDENGYERFREMHEKGMETHRYSLYFFLLIDKNSNLPIGECGFHTWNATHRRAELYYLLRDDTHKKKGLMTEALAEVIRYGFECMGLHRIEALVATWNEPSLKLLRHFRFSFEGTMREDYVIDGKSESSDCYSLLKQEWLSATEKV
jgi:ribosomal-protein-alanine N-acetyltransferase